MLNLYKPASKIIGRIINVKSHMNTFNYFYGFKTQPQFIYNTSKVFCCFFSGKEIADFTLQTIIFLLSQGEFELHWQKTVQQAEVIKIIQSCLPRKGKRPAKLLNENKEPLYDQVSDVKVFYRRIYFDAIYTLTNCIKTTFLQT